MWWRIQGVGVGGHKAGGEGGGGSDEKKVIIKTVKKADRR